MGAKDRRWVPETIGNHYQVCKKYGGQSSKQDVINVINAGVGVLNYRGHGSEVEWQASNGLSKADVPGLANESMTPQILSIACLNNRIDHDAPCFGASWILAQKAVTFLGASRPSYTDVNHIFDKYLWDTIIHDGVKEAGRIFNLATARLYLNNPGVATEHNIHMYLLLGDPMASL